MTVTRALSHAPCRVRLVARLAVLPVFWNRSSISLRTYPPGSPGRSGVGPRWFNADVATRSDDFLQLVAQLEGVERSDSSSWSTFRVRGQTFGYLWERTQTVGLKQLLSEQLALVAERPDVFEVQFAAGQFGWVVVTRTGRPVRAGRADLRGLSCRPRRPVEAAVAAS